MSAGRAEAATATGNATIQATLVATCTIGTVPDLAFGNFDGSSTLASARDATATLTIGCSDQADYTVYLGPGIGGLADGQRQMQNGAARLPYEIYQDSGHIVPWNETGGPDAVGGAGGVSDTGTGANKTIHVYGQIAAGTPIPGITGSYSDTVTVTVAY